MGRCPVCHQGPIMRTWFVAHEKCPVCGAVYERGEGTWIGTTLFGYSIVAVVGIAGGIALIATDTYTYGRFLLLLLGAAALVFLVHPVSKITWIQVLHGMGKVYPDPPSTRP